jgi:hypothetical protein
MTWYFRMATSLSLFWGLGRLSTVPSGSLPNAPSVGAVAVNGPSPLSVSTRPAPFTAATRVLTFSAPAAVSTMSFSSPASAETAASARAANAKDSRRTSLLAVSGTP